jgi:hypothetical protein
MKPKDAYQVLTGMIQQDHHEIACEPLLDWLRTTLTLRGGANPLPVTCIAPLMAPVFMNPQDQQGFTAYRVGVVHKDFPHLWPGQVHNSAAIIAQAINALTEEYRLTRHEAMQHRVKMDSPKQPSDYFGILLEKLMRWCQVDNEADLPPIYQEIANAKNDKIRVLLQTAVEKALQSHNYMDDFPLSATLVNKITELRWAASVSEDFSSGINIFTIGCLDDEAPIEHQRILNQQPHDQHAGTIYAGDAAPMLIDIATVQDSKQDICIPTTLAQLRYLVERSQALWQVLLGVHHPITQQHKLYRELLLTNEERLERVVPRDPAMKFMVPSLLARVIQLEVNVWLRGQAKTAAPLPFTTLVDVFEDIAYERQWERNFPQAYLRQLTQQHSTTVSISGAYSNTNTAASTLSATIMSNATQSIPAPIVPRSPPTTHNSSVTPSSVLRNPIFKDSIFGRYKAMGFKARALKESLRRRKVTCPTNALGQGMCLTYHVMGVCNNKCKFADDHYKHNDQEDERLRAWCDQHYKLDV